NSILASKGYLLALAEREQLVWLGRVWPPRTASHLTHLARARRLVLGTWDHHVSTSGVPEHWHNFVHELRISSEVEDGSLVGDVRTKLAELDAPRTFDVVTGRRELAEIVDSLEVAVRNFEDQPAEETSPDDAALLGVLHLVMVDAAASIGEIALGQTCLRRAIRMAEHPAQGSAPVMLGAMLARGAFLAALDGQPAVAHARVAAFFENSRKVGEPRHVAKTLIRIAQRYPCMDSLNATDTVRRIDPESPFAPFSAEAEALRVLLVHGPGAAIDWATSMLSRGGLSTRPGWEWWPLHAFLALLSAREGRLSTARNWLDRSTFPPSLDLVVRAFVEFASGNRDRALSLVEELRARVDVPNRWRQIATGIWLAAQSQEENGTASRSIMVESQDWETALAPLALLPDAARALILPNLPPDLAELPGLVVGPDIEPPSEVRLTPRQIDILHALDTGRTMGEIGRSMYLSVETVRSTAKALYRRLGVNDRESALAAGRERGFL
ncbi:MAG: LuxR C-terminal-related transcriptional regulator, partial [Propionibacteriaceae bacterium]|nr:LuxR C-terminal-related transcriptional regulator [Propionibacteriaceae bacterium]